MCPAWDSSVKHERQLAAGPAAGQDTATVDIAAELDLRLLDHAYMMPGSESLLPTGPSSGGLWHWRSSSYVGHVR